MSISSFALQSNFNVKNAMASSTLSELMRVRKETIRDCLSDFENEEHRLENVLRIHGVEYINDSKATNVGATIAALVGLPGKHVLIAGGDAKGADFSELTEIIEQHCRAVVLMGKDAARIASIIPEGILVEQVVDMQSAVLAAQAFAQPGDNVLLAPACASFDMFNDFEHRGDVFAAAVESLLEVASS